MDLTHGKYLAVDYGDKRTGLADCDPSGLIASGIGTISEGGMTKTAERVAREATARGAKKIIVGLPKNMDGTEGEKAASIRIFADMLRGMCDIPVELYDERMTTMVAHRFLTESGTFGKKRKGVVDTLSAEIILQNYLDRARMAGGR